MSVAFLPSQIGGAASTPIAYTGAPLRLLFSDILLTLRNVASFSGIFLPLRMHPDELDELYPSRANLIAISLHTFLFIAQSAFLVSLPFFFMVPLLWFCVYVVAFLVLNDRICRILNGSKTELKSQVPIKYNAKHEEEYWIFINGVSVGRDWLQGNIDRLSLTFGRPVVGVHNPTSGILFDLIQCLVQRNFCYSTQDVRDAYVLIKQALLNEKYKKVVFIMHSQGGIEGGLIVDWLLDEVPQDLLRRLEVYSFGNAANHFNNPHRSISTARTAQSHGGSESQSKAIRHIEHYANVGDFVSRFGVLNFTRVPNRYMGRLFESPRSGHLLNQHYLHDMFPLGPDGRALDTNEFMEMEVSFSQDAVQPDGREDILSTFSGSAGTSEDDVAFVGDVNTPISPLTISSPHSTVPRDRIPRAPRVKDFSRLWRYRNGQSPPDD